MATPSEIRRALTCALTACPCHRPAGDVHCPAHEDRHPSFGIAEDDGKPLVFCRSGCGQREVIAALVKRGLWGPEDRPAIHLRAYRPQLDSPVQVIAVALAGLEPWTRPGVLALYRTADERRQRDARDQRAIAEVRRYAASLGDTEAAWDLLARATEAETALRALGATEDVEA